MKEHELFRISMQEYREANWPGRRRASMPRDMHRVRRDHVHRRGGDVLARRRRMRSVELVDVHAQSRGDMLGCSEGWVAEMNGLWSRHVSPWRGEDRAWSTAKFGVGLSELPLGLWLVDDFLILWQVGEVLVS
ncbi:hypothetical protein CRG98_001231 [Punica granatum]|uniref:Uncharacterized protein n=1 Tax=Punica granatum TaxID=22663 RepID=A0A2I0LCG4_PUNGR|nr:hypothetical protein CRG98_001231 [Punica granatum]